MYCFQDSSRFSQKGYDKSFGDGNIYEALGNTDRDRDRDSRDRKAHIKQLNENYNNIKF